VVSNDVVQGSLEDGSTSADRMACGYEFFLRGNGDETSPAVTVDLKEFDDISINIS
jgi:hypothetical protein